MVINEFLPRAGTDWNHDGEINVYDEFIELKNNGPIDVDLAGWKLDDVADDGSPPFTLPSVKLKPGERAVFYGLLTKILLEDSGDTVRLINTRNVVIDARGYGVVEQPDVSHCRIPDGYYWRMPASPRRATRTRSPAWPRRCAPVRAQRPAALPAGGYRPGSVPRGRVQRLRQRHVGPQLLGSACPPSPSSCRTRDINGRPSWSDPHAGALTTLRGGERCASITKAISNT